VAVDALLAYGTRLYYSTDGSTYTELSDVLKIGSPGDPEAPEVDVTPLTPTAAWREFRLGLNKAGEFSFDQHFNKTRYSLLDGRRRLSTYWRIIYPDNATPANASKVEFVGYIRKLTISELGNPDDIVKIMCAVQLSGAVTFTQGS